MITAKFYLKPSNGSIHMTLKGHAKAAPYGEDLICASATMLAYTVAQAVQFMQITPLSLAEINMKHSYTVGDALLYEISHYLSKAFPQGRLFRTASVTFTLMLPYESDEKAALNLEEISKRMEEEWVLGEISAQVNCAIAEMRCSKLKGTPSEIVEQLEYTHLIAKERRGVVSFDDSTVVLHTALGTIIIQGQELQLKTLSLAGGKVVVDGNISAMIYEEPRSSWRRRLLG